MTTTRIIDDGVLPVLQIRNLKVYYGTEAGEVKAVDDVSLDLQPKERLALVGESGSGKTTLAMAIMRLHKPPGRIVDGEILLNGNDILDLDEEEMRMTRLAEIALVAQAAMNALNPVMRIEDQIIDGLVDHGDKRKKNELREHVRGLLERVGLEPEVANMFPHELSGGMKQRVLIATATALNPMVIIADEPTTALDVVVQRQVMITLGRLQKETGAAVIIVGHEMGLMGQFADRIGVMYAGKLVELGSVEQMVKEPRHPYSKLLIESVPDLNEKREKLTGIPGMPPALIELPTGCGFHPRCPSATPKCSEITPKFQQLPDKSWVACHLFDDSKVGA
ncbi:MAG: ABC transporter ATP-binding protein [Dehalococcoidia bacterium]|nr:ABC transporter ATP-binding protein [Dehalococcoidia bacterium]